MARKNHMKRSMNPWLALVVSIALGLFTGFIAYAITGVVIVPAIMGLLMFSAAMCALVEE